MSQTDRVARAVVVHGRVQGVFFRDSCRRQAEDAGVVGWVSNAADGSVHAQFEGRAATVVRVDVHEVPPEGLSRFEVR